MCTNARFGVLLLFAFIVMGCGNTEENAAAEKETSEPVIEIESDQGTVKIGNLEETVKKMEEAFNSEEGKQRSAVDYRDLKDLLPKKMAGMPRTEHDGQRTKTYGIEIATASAVYTSEDRRLNVSITDATGLGAAMMALASWSNMEFDREGDDGYERTTTIEGYKAFEQYNRKDRSGSVALLVENRFIVAIEGSQIEEGDLQRAIKGINMHKLSRMQ